MNLLSISELEQIIQCDSLGSLDASKLRFLNSPPDNLRSANKKSIAAVSGILASATFIDVLLSNVTIGFEVFGTAALSFTLICLAVGGIIGACCFYNEWQKQKKKESKNLAFFQLAELKLHALDELICREKAEFTKLNKPITLEEGPVLVAPVNNSASKLPKGKSYLIVGSIFVSITLSYLVGLSSIFETLGYITLVGAFTGPAGCALAFTTLLAAMAIGVYLGCKHYQARQRTHFIETQKNSMNKQLGEKEKFYHQLVKRREKIMHDAQMAARDQKMIVRDAQIATLEQKITVLESSLPREPVAQIPNGFSISSASSPTFFSQPCTTELSDEENVQLLRTSTLG